MSLTPPPPRTVAMVNWFSPGFWAQFVRAANSALPAGTVVSSWYRSPALNVMLGGLPDSQHLIGSGFDAIPFPNTAATRAALAGLIRSKGFITALEIDHVHAQA